MKNVIKKRFVRVQEAAARAHHKDVAPASPGDAAQPTPGVRLVRVEGQVHALEVTCRCGEVSVIELEYEAAE